MMAAPPPTCNLRFLRIIENPEGTNAFNVIISVSLSQVSVINTMSAFFSIIKSLISVDLFLQDLALMYKALRSEDLSIKTLEVSILIRLCLFM